jgi:hypothetical protein
MLREGREKAICLNLFPLPSLLQPSFMGKRRTRSPYKTPLIQVWQGSIGAFLEFFLDIRWYLPTTLGILPINILTGQCNWKFYFQYFFNFVYTIKFRYMYVIILVNHVKEYIILRSTTKNHYYSYAYKTKTSRNHNAVIVIFCNSVRISSIFLVINC